MSQIGILALQGAFAAHGSALQRRGHEVRFVTSPEHLEGLAGLVLPGGESTVQLSLLEAFALEAPLRAFVAAGRPVLATCAGLILLARHVRNPEQRSLALLDVTVARNAWGRQVESFEATADATGTPLVFIRAPRIVEVAREVTVVERLDGEPVAVRQGNVLGATFHPELAEPTPGDAYALFAR